MHNILLLQELKHLKSFNLFVTMTKEKKEEDDEQEETAANVEDETKTEDQLAPEDEVPPPPAEEISNDDQVSAKVKRHTIYVMDVSDFQFLFEDYREA